MKKGINLSTRILTRCFGTVRTTKTSECCPLVCCSTSESMRAQSLLATSRTACNFQLLRSFSSDPPNGGNSDETKKIHDETKPLSRLSDDDLHLAIQAANEDEDGGLSATTNSSINIDQIPGTSKGGSRKLAIIFTCNVCNTRSAKRFTERAYNHGVVLIRCPKCDSLHLIADRLGYFSDKDDGKGWDIETFMKSIGQEDNIKVATEGQEVFEVTLKDVLGDKIHDSVENPDEGKKD